MRLVGSEGRVLRILDEVIALRGELPYNVWTIGRLVSRDEAVSHHQLACAVGSTVPDTAATLVTGIAIHGAKDYLRLGSVTTVEDASTGPLSHVIRDRAVDQRECPAIVGDATTAVSQITGDRAVDNGEHSSSSIVDAATTRLSPISRDRAVDEGQLPSLLVVDAAAIRVAARWKGRFRGVSECRIARDRAVDQCKCPRIVEGTGLER